MPHIAIIVEFEALPGQAEALIALLLQHASLTRAEEPGCLRFEVLQAVDTAGRAAPGRFLVNELYADRAAVVAHRANARMPAVGAAIAALVSSRRLIEAEVCA